MLDVIKPGSRVQIGPDAEPIQATVIGVQIQLNRHVAYHVCWWEAGDRQEEVLESCEVTQVEGTETERIGFT